MRCLSTVVFTLVFSLTVCAQISIPESAEAKYALRQANPFEWMYDTIYVDQSSTLIDGVKWDAVYLTRNRITDGRIAIQHPRLLCYLREDNDLVYYKGVGAEDHKEGIIYDYSMEVGDSAWMVAPEFNAIDSVLYVVDSLSTLSCSETGGGHMVMHVKYLAPPPRQQFSRYESRWLKPVGDLYHPIAAAVCLEDNFCEELYLDFHIFLNDHWVDSRELTCEDLLSNVNYQDIVPSKLKLYPNPWRSGEALHLSLPEEQVRTIAIFEVGSGRQLFQRTFVPTFTISTRLPPLRPGAYLVVVQTESGKVMVQKMVVG